MYLLEEAYETLDAIERAQPEEICEELGDLLFQIIFLSRMAEEKGDFDLVAVMEAIHEKMVRRHPHVFGTSTARTAEEVSLNWAKIKEREKGEDRGEVSPFDTIPVGLPALLRAHRIGERAAKAGLLRTDVDALSSRIHEILQALESADREEDGDVPAGERIGDLLFLFANLARMRGFNAEDLLREANQRFLSRPRSAPEEGQER
jgi:MazG family protein